MWNRSKTSLVAIDLSPEAVRVLDVDLKRGVPRIRALATAPLPEGQADTLPQRHLEVLASLLQSHPIRPGRCVATMPTSLVTTRSVAIDATKPLSPQEQVRATLMNILSFDASDLVMDHWTVAETPGKESAQALVVAAQKSVIQHYLRGFRKLKLACTHMDVAPCALAELIARLLPENESMVGTVALGESLGYFAVVEKRRVLFWRPFELSSAGVAPKSAVERVGDEISKCVSHMVGSLQLEGMSEILAFGQGADDEAFAGCIQTRFNVKVRAPSPFEPFATDALPAGLIATLQPAAVGQFAAVAGLAFQSPAISGANHG